MQRSKITVALAVAAGVALLGTGCSSDSPEDFPTRDINVTVPFGAGGSTDLTARSVGEPLGEFFGNKIITTNTPGAAGSVGTQSVLNADNDGYTILADGMLSFTSMPIMGTLDTMPADWEFWLATFTPNIIAVPADSPYQTIDDLIEAMGSGDVSAGSAGPGSSGHIGAEILAGAAGVEYEHVAYEGGAPAVVATLSGEVDFTAQLLVEMQDQLIAGELRGLATLAESAVELDGGITIPTLADALPEVASLLPMGETTGFAVPKGLDDAILTNLDEGFAAATEAQSFLDFCAENGMEAVAMDRESSNARLQELQSIVAWTLWDAGVAENNPEDLGIARP